ncbi:ATP-binding protein [Paenibacillus sp. BR2-3]|uniref:ATP-binding protein n=1 Tax=Paenibacillus sp. BR2-3 TaxID=3048494 RepID=UPI003977504D
MNYELFKYKLIQIQKGVKAMPHHTDNYNVMLVILSVLIALLACFISIDLTDRLLRGTRKQRSLLLISFVLGIGLWSMHFIGMLAMETTKAMTYHTPLLFFSLFMPILSSYAPLLLISSPQARSKPYLILSGAVFSTGLLIMHYSGIMALKLSASIEQNTSSFVFSVVFALAAVGVIASFNEKWLKNEYNLFSYKKITIILLLTGAMTAMHYTAMAGTSFSSAESGRSTGRVLMLNNSLLALIVGGAFLFIVSLVIRLLYMDRQNVLSKARFYEQHYMTLFQLSPDMVICIDPVQKKIVSANPAVYNTTGFSKQQILHIFNEEDRGVIIRAVQKAAKGHSSKLEISVRTKSGKVLVCSSSVFPLQSDHQNYVYIVSKDVTERVQFQQELIIAKEAAEGAARMKSEFLATMSHEIRTPLNGILGINELLADELNDPELLELLKLQAKSSQALLKVIDDVLELSRMEADAVQLQTAPFRLSLLLQECMDLFEVIIRNKNLRLELSVSDAIPDLLIGDAARIRQILVNLIGNAVKFTPSGKVSLILESCCTEGETISLQFKVSDTGIGVDPDKLGLLFQPFTQLDAAHNRKFSGMGLGLSICKKLVDLMNGEIWAAAAKGGGAEFAFRIPLQAPKSAHPAPINKAENKVSIGRLK